MNRLPLVRVEIIKTGRKLEIPAGALIAGSVWLLFVLTAVAIALHLGRPLQLCWFKRLTGIPCPTCGTTRGVFLILKGNVLQGWLYNPLVFTLLPALFLHILFQLISGHRIKYNLSPAGAKLAPILLIIAVIGNWVYEIFVVG